MQLLTKDTTSKITTDLHIERLMQAQSYRCDMKFHYSERQDSTGGNLNAIFLMIFIIREVKLRQ